MLRVVPPIVLRDARQISAHVHTPMVAEREKEREGGLEGGGTVSAVS